jgi:hypothetical protein
MADLSSSCDATTASLNENGAEKPQPRLDDFKNIDVKVQGGDVHIMVS